MAATLKKRWRMKLTYELGLTMGMSYSNVQSHSTNFIYTRITV